MQLVLGTHNSTGHYYYYYCYYYYYYIYYIYYYYYYYYYWSHLSVYTNFRYTIITPITLIVVIFY